LKDIESPVRANDGLVLYTGSAHLLSSIRNVNFDQYGILHMGQMGDGVLGTFLTGPTFKKAKLTSGAYSTRLLHRVAEPVQKIIDSYENEEMYKMYSRGFNGVFNGNWSTNQFTECCSPFLDTEFLSYALTIPPALKYPDRLYIEWILQKHPAVAKYVWERTKTKITTPRFLRFMRMAWKSVNVKVLGRLHLASMNPFDYWYKTNDALRTVIAKHFDENISLLDSYSELKKDCQELYAQGGLREKTQVLTLIQAMRMLGVE
jgi:asparagine synthase (glutamine-hydrolysing)